MNLDEIESRLQSLLEVELLKLIPGYKNDDRIIHKLASSMQGNVRKSNEGLLAPNVLVIVAHPNTLASWRGNPTILEQMSDAVHSVGSEIGWKFSTRPTITTAVDTSLEEGEIKILASFSDESFSDTVGVTPDRNDKQVDTIPNNAFLILHGTKIVPLNRAVINIGRRVDNQVVIDDPRVSRNHAQLRVIKGRYVVFDLNSTGGTYVNNQRTTQTVLYPGDVISLAGVTLIFGQDLPSTSGYRGDITSRNIVGAGDRPTAIFKAKDEEQD
jgi:hypothetical protein